MKTLRSILVPIDFSKASAAALREASRLAAQTHAKVRAIHVIEPVVFDVTPPMILPPMPSAADLIADAKSAWTSFATDVPGKASITLDCPLGSPTWEILHAAKSHAADLIIVGAYGTLDEKRGVGPIALNVARHAECSVMLVAPEHAGPFARVLVGVDMSDASRTAVEAGVRFASTDSAALTLAHAYADPWAKQRDIASIARAMPDFREQYASGIARQLEEFLSTSPDLKHELAAIKPSIRTLASDRPASAISQLARDSHADLIILGPRGKSRLRDLIFGSTAERVIRESRVSLLIARPSA